jgi:hypothetical protein
MDRPVRPGASLARRLVYIRPVLLSGAGRLRLFVIAVVLALVVGLVTWAKGARQPEQTPISGVDFRTIVGHEWVTYRKGDSEWFFRLDQMVAVRISQFENNVTLYVGGHKIYSNLTHDNWEMIEAAYAKEQAEKDN